MVSAGPLVSGSMKFGVGHDFRTEAGGSCISTQVIAWTWLSRPTVGCVQSKRRRGFFFWKNRETLGVDRDKTSFCLKTKVDRSGRNGMSGWVLGSFWIRLESHSH